MVLSVVAESGEGFGVAVWGAGELILPQRKPRGAA